MIVVSYITIILLIIVWKITFRYSYNSSLNGWFVLSIEYGVFNAATVWDLFIDYYLFYNLSKSDIKHILINQFILL